MIAVDTNILVYAHRRDSPQFDLARRRVAELARDEQGWAIPWPCVHEFVGIVTHPKIFKKPTPVATAIDQVNAWQDSGGLHLLAETSATWRFVESVLVGAAVVGPRVRDAKVAAICLTHRVDELWTADRDFSRFPALRTRNPLNGSEAGA